MESDRNAALITAASIIAIAIAIPGVLWGISEIIKAVGPAIGAVITAAEAGAVAAPIVGTVTGLGVAAGGAAIGYVVIFRTIERIKKDLFTALLPIITLWTGAWVDLSKELFHGTDMEKVFFAIIGGAFTLVGGLLAEQKWWPFKALGIVACFLPPLFYAELIVLGSGKDGFLTAFADMQPVAYVTVGVLVATSIVVALLAWRGSK